MQQHVAVRVPAQSPVVRQHDPANLQRNPRPKFMRVKSVPDSHAETLATDSHINMDLFSFILIHQATKLWTYCSKLSERDCIVPHPRVSALIRGREVSFPQI